VNLRPEVTTEGVLPGCIYESLRGAFRQRELQFMRARSRSRQRGIEAIPRVRVTLNEGGQFAALLSFLPSFRRDGPEPGA